MKNVLLSGGLGFIGSNFIHYLMNNTDCKIMNIDKQTYAGNPDNIKEYENNDRLINIKADINDIFDYEDEIVDFNPDVVVHMAAESHVDRSIDNPWPFIHSNIIGTFKLLEFCRKKINPKKMIIFETDEIYGSVKSGDSYETDRLEPSSVYSASKASTGLLSRAYNVTYGLPVITVRPCNNYGQYQYPEKLIPLFITNLLEDKKVPVYGTGENQREWLHVEDCCDAIWFLCNNGTIGRTYNIGTGCRVSNIEITKKILEIMNKGEDSIEYVEDRKGHDWRYAISSYHINKLGWYSKIDFEDGLRKTIEWYRNNREWWVNLKNKL